MKPRNAFTATLLALLTVALPATAATHVVQQDALAFSPDVVVINVGDTVTWQWTSFSHTVTNGAGSADPNVGRTFDAALNSLSPTFSHTFTTAGTVPYFCRPHEPMGMSGTVIVQNTSGVDQVPARGPLALGSAPNPFNPRTLISFTLPADANVRLSVHDAGGRLVRVLEDGIALTTGRHESSWDGLGDDGLVVPPVSMSRRSKPVTSARP